MPVDPHLLARRSAVVAMVKQVAGQPIRFARHCSWADRSTPGRHVDVHTVG